MYQVTWHGRYHMRVRFPSSVTPCNYFIEFSPFPLFSGGGPPPEAPGGQPRARLRLVRLLLVVLRRLRLVRLPLHRRARLQPQRHRALKHLHVRGARTPHPRSHHREVDPLRRERKRERHTHEGSESEERERNEREEEEIDYYYCDEERTRAVEREGRRR